MALEFSGETGERPERAEMYETVPVHLANLSNRPIVWVCNRWGTSSTQASGKKRKARSVFSRGAVLTANCDRNSLGNKDRFRTGAHGPLNLFSPKEGKRREEGKKGRVINARMRASECE